MEVFTEHEMNLTELTDNKATQIHDTFIGHARRHHDLIGCSETRTLCSWLILNTPILMRLFTCGCLFRSSSSGPYSSVQFMCFERAFTACLRCCSVVGVVGVSVAEGQTVCRFTALDAHAEHRHRLSRHERSTFLLIILGC